MGLADLPEGFVTLERDEIMRRSKRDFLLRNPEADVTSGQPDLDARLDADLVLPLYSDARLIADGINESEATGDRLDRVGERIGKKRGKERGASGYVAVTAAAGGGLLQAGVHELLNPKTRIRYEIAETKTRQDGEHIRIRARDTGPKTDLAAGAVLNFTNPPPGIGQIATVVQQGGGRGLTGGAERESDTRYLARIQAHKQNPPAGDNDAELARVIEETPDVAVEQVFTYPGIYAGGSSAFTFTVLAPEVGASRLPTEAQLQAAYEWILAQMPGDNSYFPLVPTVQNLFLALKVAWATGGWADVAPWPAAYAHDVSIASATSATAFVVSTAGGSAPVAGMTVAVWDRNLRKFQRKRFATVTGSGPYTVTCATANGASDTTYTPQAGQKLSPWSDNLEAVPAPVLAYMATLGPSEIVGAADIPDPEGRQRIRQPRAPKAWPITTTSKVENDVTALPEVESCDALAGVGVTVTPSLPPKLLELSDLAFFAA